MLKRSVAVVLATVASIGIAASTVHRRVGEADLQVHRASERSRK